MTYIIGLVYVYHSVWSVTTADNFTPAERDESF